jgi:hypothetical protein
VMLEYCGFERGKLCLFGYLVYPRIESRSDGVGWGKRQSTFVKTTSHSDRRCAQEWWSTSRFDMIFKSRTPVKRILRVSFRGPRSESQTKKAPEFDLSFT